MCLRQHKKTIYLAITKNGVTYINTATRNSKSYNKHNINAKFIFSNYFTLSLISINAPCIFISKQSISKHSLFSFLPVLLLGKSPLKSMQSTFTSRASSCQPTWFIWKKKENINVCKISFYSYINPTINPLICFKLNGLWRKTSKKFLKFICVTLDL